MGRTAVIHAVVMACALGAVAAPARAAEDEREARKDYEQATLLYNAGEFDRAIAAYKQAYLRSPAPGLLFNIAQAYRAKRDAHNALYFYDAYLRAAPAAAERPFVEARMAELRAQPQEPPVREQRSGLRTAGMITAAAGGALILGGLVFAVEAHGAFDDVAMGGDPDPGKGAQVRSMVLTGAGVVTMITGALMIHAGTRVAPVVAPGGAGLAVSGSF